MNEIKSLLQRIYNVISTIGGMAFVPSTGNTTINGIKTFSSSPEVPDTPADTHSAMNEVFADTRYNRSYGQASNTAITGLTTFAITSISGYANYNAVQFTSTNSTETLNNITAIPTGVPWKITASAGLTITFKSTTTGGNLKLGLGGSDFVMVGSNGDFAWFQTIGGVTYMIGAKNYE